MKSQVLSPRVQNGEKPNPGSQMTGIGGDLQQRFGCRAKYHAVHHPVILKSQSGHGLGQHEDDMEVGHL